MISGLASHPNGSVFRFYLGALCLPSMPLHLNCACGTKSGLLDLGSVWPIAAAQLIWKSAAFYSKSQPCAVLVSQQGCTIGFALFKPLEPVRGKARSLQITDLIV